MNITTTIPDESLPAWQARVNQYNVGSQKPPVTIPEFCQIMQDEETARHIADKNEADKTLLGSNQTLIEIGLQVVSASPEKQAAAIAAAQAILQS